MRELTEKERRILFLAGKMCYEDIINEVEYMEIQWDGTEQLDYDQDRLRKAEAEAWAELYRRQRLTKIRRWTVVMVCLIFALVLAFANGKPTVAYQRLCNKGFMVENETSMSIFLSNTVLVPDNWNGGYVLGLVPSGYEIESSYKLKTVQSIMYTNELGEYIDFSVGDHNYNANSDTENCVVEYIMINGVNGKLLTRFKDGVVEYYAVSWESNEMFFDVTSNGLNRENILILAESVMIAE